MKCKAYFSGMSVTEHNDLDKQIRFKRKLTCSPNRVGPAVELHLNNLKSRIMVIEERGSNYRNLDKDEGQALKNLKGCKDIVIKNADKESAVVVWGIEQCQKEAYKQLEESLIYEKIHVDPLECICEAAD